MISKSALKCLFLAAALVVAGCPSTTPRRIADGSIVDASRDSNVPSDAMPDVQIHDGSIDADAGLDDAGLVDAGLDSGMDATVDDAGGSTGPTCDPGVDCGAGDSCDDGLTCVTNACGLKVCQPRAAQCAYSSECATGSLCVSTAAAGDLCTPTNGEVCNASSDCPPSHACEGAPGSRACVLRRIPCMDESECPVSHMCLSVPGDSEACQYVYRPCTLLSTCPLQVCSDIDGDGMTECGGGGPCEQNTDCSSAGDRCVNAAFVVSCAQGGLCRQSGGDACATGFECLDLHGDGYGECVATGGECATQADCGTGEVCAVAQIGAAPSCIAPM